MFECLVFLEDGEVLCYENRIYPETKIVKKVRMITETDSIEDASACIDQMLDQYFAVYGTSEWIRKEYLETHDEYYCKVHQVYNNDSWVLRGVIPDLSDSRGFCGTSPDTSYTRYTYKRFYWILKNAEQNFLAPKPFEYKESAPETCP